MKIIFSLTFIFLFFLNAIYSQNSNLPFENNEITIEKIMAGFFALCIYFIPTIIARDKIHFKLIFIFNLLTAWTVFGWFISFVWSINAKSKKIELLKKEENLDN